MNDQKQGYDVPLDTLLAAVEEQRNAALTEAAQMKALAMTFKAELDARDELEKQRAEADDGPFGS